MSYDAWKTATPEDDADPFAPGCPVCSGDEDAAPCTEECAALVTQCRREKELASYRFALRQVVRMAARYRSEGPAPDFRVKACLIQARYYRTKIRRLQEVA